MNSSYDIAKLAFERQRVILREELALELHARLKDARANTPELRGRVTRFCPHGDGDSAIVEMGDVQIARGWVFVDGRSYAAVCLPVYDRVRAVIEWYYNEVCDHGVAVRSFTL